MHNKFLKGSEWNKWDLHVHTPASVLTNEFGDDWDNYVKILFKKAIENKIVAIGITDYYLIDGYKKIKREYLENSAKMKELFSDDEILAISDILVFPNLEFRINKLVISKETDLQWNRKVNFHVLLSDKILLEDIEENLLNRLTFEDIGVSEGSSQELTLTKRNLETFGQRLKKEQAEFASKPDIYVGMLNASISDTELVKLLSSNNKVFQGKYLLGLPSDEDLSIVSWKSQGHTARKVLIQKSHFLFSSNPKTVKFGLGETHNSEEEFISEFKSIKPCLWGSDAHSFEKLFKPDLNKFTWIKSNPTFEGLKQVIYEPAERVKIVENCPEEKTPYLVIDKVRFVDKTDNKNFSKNWIELNQNLNTIIGGKSSGKSLILFHIAKTLSPKQIKEKTEIVAGFNYDEFLQKHPFDFEILWKNGVVHKLSDTPAEQDVLITYVPQLYINHLAEKEGFKHLSDLINTILKQNENFYAFIENQNSNILGCKTIIQQNIDELLQLRDLVKEINKEKQAIGEKEKIVTETKRLSTLIDNLRKLSGFSEIENKQYEKLIKTFDFQTKKLIQYQNIKTSLNSFSFFHSNIFDKYIKQIEIETSKYKSTVIEQRILSRLFNQITKSNTLANTEIQDSFTNYLQKIDEKIKKHKTQLTVIEQNLKPFQNKIKNQDLLKKYLQELDIQNNKTIELDKKDKKLKEIIENGKNVNLLILGKYSELFENYKLIETELQKEEFKKIGEELELESELFFDTNAFQAFTNLFDNRSHLSNTFYTAFNGSNEFNYSRDNHLQTIRLVFDNLKDLSNLSLRTYTTPKQLYSTLLEDYFKFNYSIKYKGDNILKMSPGKKGLVLLQLILHLSNASHPILIDQPEDNLDNRTIYDELKQYIRGKKTKRQIIIVTHNANLVVATDAENIIVANQSGQQHGKDKKEFLFEYISGGLENTFSDPEQEGILYKFGIKEHVCDILEGGKNAFLKREEKYGFIND